MSSRRIYITLNDKKEKDKIILDYLSGCYSESDAIKEHLYQIAMNRGNISPLGTNNNIKMQNSNNSTFSVHNEQGIKEIDNELSDTDGYNKVQTGDNNININNDADISNSTEKVQKSEEQIKREQEEAERKAKELAQIKIFL